MSRAALRHVAAIRALFFVSGFTALVLEVAWAKQAHVLFGNTTFAAAAVVAGFMTGLTAGSAWFGRFADRHPERCLRGYGLLEAGVALYALAFPLLARALEPVTQAIVSPLADHFLASSIARFALAFVLLAPPTILMGGSFPLLARHLQLWGRRPEEDVTRLYTSNLAGAACGAFLAGFFLVPKLGISGASAFAAALNFAIAAFALRARLPRPDETDEWTGPPMPVSVETEGRKDATFLFALLFAHGFVGFVLQIAWTRVTALVLGASTYAFSAMLTMFLAGLAFGAWAVRRRAAVSLALVGWLEVALGVLVLGFVPVFEWIVYAFASFFPWISRSTGTYFATLLVFSAILVGVPAFVLGMVFPACLRLLERRGENGRVVGDAYAINTLGAVLGAASAAFFLIWHLGLHGSLKLCSVISVLLGVAALARSCEFRAAWIPRALALALSWALFFAIPWNRHLFSSGVFLYAGILSHRSLPLDSKRAFERALEQEAKMLYYRDGYGATVTILEYPRATSRDLPNLALRVNGKTDASTGGDMVTQLSAAYLPMLAHRDPRDVLVIGLGSGVTVGAVAEFAEPRRIDGVEIEPAILEAVKYFKERNGDPLADPRVRLRLADARNHVRTSGQKYDVIISEPSNPWMSGISSLFTREHYRASVAALKDGGIYCQWLHAYQMPRREFAMVLDTFAEAFPQVTLFRSNRGDFFLMGSKAPIRFDGGRVARFVDSPAFRSHIQFFRPYNELFVPGFHVMADADLRRLLAEKPGPVNTDDRPRLEYESPKHLYHQTSEQILRWLYRAQRAKPFPDIEGESGMLFDRPDAWKLYYYQGSSAVRSDNAKGALPLLREASRRTAGREPSVELALGEALEKLGAFEEAIRIYDGLIYTPGNWRTLATAAGQRARILSALAAEGKEPDAKTLHRLGMLGIALGDREKGLGQLKRAVDLAPEAIDACVDLAAFYYVSGREDLARPYVRRASRLAPADPRVKKLEGLHDKIQAKKHSMASVFAGREWAQKGESARAIETFERALSLDPDNAMAHSEIAAALRKDGRAAQAERHERRVHELLAARVASGGTARAPDEEGEGALAGLRQL